MTINGGSQSSAAKNGWTKYSAKVNEIMDREDGLMRIVDTHAYKNPSAGP